MSHGTQATVLLIEADPSLRRLITLGLQYRGMHVIAASSLNNLPALETFVPSLLILDVDGSVDSDRSMLTAVQTHPYLASLPIVTLAWECPSLATAVDVTNQPQTNTFQAHTTCLTKPFDARTLHTAIEQLLVATTLSAAATMAATPATMQTATTAPSIWPIITAAGLLIAFIGLMGFIAFTILGLSIVIIALLLWTLGSNTKVQYTPIPISS